MSQEVFDVKSNGRVLLHLTTQNNQSKPLSVTRTGFSLRSTVINVIILQM